MPFAAAGTLANVEQSLDLYCQRHLTDTEGLTVHYFGDRAFIPPGEDPWVRVLYGTLNLRRQYGRQVDAATLGSLVLGSLDLVLAQRARLWPTRYRLSTVRDQILPYFAEGRSIPVYDVAQSTDVAVAELQCHTLQETSLDDGSLTGLVQWSIQVGTRWLELRTV